MDLTSKIIHAGYDDSWAIYAQKIDGEFKPYSPARGGQRCYENGGLLDECEFFCTCASAKELLAEWFDEFELREVVLWAKYEGKPLKDYLKELWEEAHGEEISRDESDRICDWLEKAADDYDNPHRSDADWLIQIAWEAWEEDKDYEEAAEQVIARINESG